MSDTLSTRIIAFREGDFWLAQCLEHDVCVQADDLNTVKSRIEIAIAAEDNFIELPRAPQKFFDLWDKRSEFNQAGKADGVEFEMALCA